MIGSNQSLSELSGTNTPTRTDFITDVVEPPSSPSPSTAASPHWIVSAKQKRQQKELGGFGPFVAFCFTVNYVVGTGFLTLPWAFAQGGIVLSGILLITVGLLADMSKNYLLETMARAEAMLDPRMHWRKGTNNGNEGKGQLVYSPMMMTPNQSTERDPLLLQGDPEQHIGTGTIEYKSFVNTTSTSNGPNLLLKKMSSLSGTSTPNKNVPSFSLPTTPRTSQPGTPQRVRHPGGRVLLRHVPPAYLVKDRKFEVNTLCRVFLGKPGLRVVTFFISLYFYSTLWAYTSVFASAMASVLPILDQKSSISISDDVNYTIYAIAFGCVVVPLSCLELDEQIVVQVCMTLCRFLMLFLMLSTSQLCANEARQMTTIDQSSTTVQDVSVPMIRWSGIPQMLPIVVFAFMYHLSIPGLAQPVRSKRKLGSIFFSTTAFCTVAYMLIGVVLASTFGPTLIEQSSNLNWKHFRGSSITSIGATSIATNNAEVDTVDDMISGLSISSSTSTWWAKAISLYIICFPAIDVLSAFPLNAITLGNNMLGAFYGSKVHEVENNRWVRIPFRLLASVPPIILAILIRELGVISDYAGTVAFITGLTIPALLFIRSQQIAKEKKFSLLTYYSSYASSTVLAFVLALFGISMLIYVLSILWFF